MCSATRWLVWLGSDKVRQNVGQECLGPSPEHEAWGLCCALLTCSLLQGCYFCVKQYALECSRIPMGQSVNSQVMALQAQLVLLMLCGEE